MTEIEQEQSRIEATRAEETPEVVAWEAAQEKVAAFWAFCEEADTQGRQKDSVATRPATYHAYFVLDDPVHTLQHRHFAEALGFSPKMPEEVDDLEIDTVEGHMLARQFQTYDDGTIFGVHYFAGEGLMETIENRPRGLTTGGAVDAAGVVVEPVPSVPKPAVSADLVPNHPA